VIQIPPSLPEAQPPRRPDAPVPTGTAPVADAATTPAVVLEVTPPVTAAAGDGLEGSADTTTRFARSALASEALALAQDAAGTEAGTTGPAEVATGTWRRLAAVLARLDASGEADAKAPVPWPGPARPATSPDATLRALRAALADSPLFALTRLGARLIPATAPEVPEAVASGAPGSNPGRDAAPGKEAIATAAALATDAGADGALSAITPGPGPAPLATWASPAAVPAPGAPGLERVPDPAVLREAVRLLLHGELAWQGELAPGVPGRVERSDEWKGAPGAPGALTRGVGLRVTMTLPALGELEVRAAQFGDALRIAIVPDQAVRARFEGGLGGLRQRLAEVGAASALVQVGDA